MPTDGVYLLVVKMVASQGAVFQANVKVQMKSEYGYLSAADYPLLTVSMINLPTRD